MKRLLPIVAVVAAVLALVAGWSWWNARPAGTPVAVEWSDAVPSDRLTSATVLALGEATHGTSEFKAARLALLKKVVDRGFTTVAWEEDFGSMVAVDRWLQGGPGTADEATQRFGYGLNKTPETRDLLVWVRAHNEGRPPDQRIRFVGVDAARPTATKAVALEWLATRNPDAARTLGERLARLDEDGRFDKGVVADTQGAVAELQAALAASDDGSPAAAEARQAARVLEQTRTRVFETGLRDPLLFDNLRWAVDLAAAQGRHHTLLFAHNGHVDRAGLTNAAPGQKLGKLAADHYGEGYRAIGTDGHRVGLLSDGAVSTLAVDSPYRGLFAGTRIGYLETAAVTGADAEVLRRPMPMVSAGEPFAAWQAWVAPLHTVTAAPAAAWDAVLYVEDAHPTTRLR